MMLYADRRLGGVTRLVYGDPEEHLLDIPADIIKCVAYMGYRDESGLEGYAGTCFFVTVPFAIQEGETWGFNYMVTARHVLEGIRAKKGAVLVRVNMADAGAAAFIEVTSKWTVPDDDTIDLAVTDLPAPVGTIDHLSLPLATFLTDDEVAGGAVHVNIGGDIFMTGLFFQQKGKSRNVPIVRLGTIAALREEPKRAQVHPKSHRRPYAYIDAYLVETRSQGGLSGSPVFVAMPRDPSVRPLIMPRAGIASRIERRPMYLLGMMQGHYEPKLPAIEVDGMGVSVNVGIGTVVPSQQILDLLNHPSLREEREKAEAAWLAEHGAVADTEAVSDDNDGL